jgi:hypothetical protein
MPSVSRPLAMPPNDIPDELAIKLTVKTLF